MGNAESTRSADTASVLGPENKDLAANDIIRASHGPKVAVAPNADVRDQECVGAIVQLVT